MEKSYASFIRLCRTVNSWLSIRATQIWILIPFSLSDKKYLSSKFCFIFLNALCKALHNAFRTLKTDLDLRPIYHKNDDETMAHLHLGLLAYWLVNTVRHQLKRNGIKSCWGEIVRIGNTQKVITTSGTNTYDKTVTTRKCTVPDDSLKRIYDILQTEHQPFTKRKSVVHKQETKKTKTTEKQLLLSG